MAFSAGVNAIPVVGTRGWTVLQAARNVGYVEVIKKLLEDINDESLTDDDLATLTDAT